MPRPMHTISFQYVISNHTLLLLNNSMHQIVNTVQSQAIRLAARSLLGIASGLANCNYSIVCCLSEIHQIYV